MAGPQATPTLADTDPGSPIGEGVLRAYLTEVVGRYWRRPISEDELDQAVRDDPGDELRGRSGSFVVAFVDGQPVGCGGVRFLDGGVAELTRLFVDAPARRQGVAARIVADLERKAAENGSTRVRLDTRSDLTEARALYARLGYREVAAFNSDPYAEHWFEKAL